MDSDPHRFGIFSAGKLVLVAEMRETASGKGNLAKLDGVLECILIQPSTAKRENNVLGERRDDMTPRDC